MENHRTGPLSVLFVEDEPDIRLIATMALGRDKDIRLAVFDSPVAALAAVDACETPFDVALLNIRLPTMSGLELMHQLRARPAYAALPVVFITSSVRPQDRQGYIDEGANGMIDKPFDPIGLSDMLRTKMCGHATHG
jgi:CheY-like chemotaxis protein